MAKPNPIVLVPGILGSELRVDGLTVWDDGLSAARTIITPSFLLPWVPARSITVLSTYDPILNFLRGKGYRSGTDLFAFDYDWRLGIEAAAGNLNSYIENTVVQSHDGRIIFIAHSLGCLVVRWLIVKNLIDPTRIEMVVAAGPPTLGSSVSFRSVAEMPDLGDGFNRIYHRVIKAWFPNFARGIELAVTNSLMAMTSLLELMPPRSIPILSNGGPQFLGAFDWPGWPGILHGLIGYVELVQNDLQTAQWPTNIPRKLILSTEHLTETGYEFDTNDPFRIKFKWPGVTDGDGRVLADSARAFGSDLPELPVSSRHDELLNDPSTMSGLATLLP